MTNKVPITYDQVKDRIADLIIKEANLEVKLAAQAKALEVAREGLKNVERFAVCGTQMNHTYCPRCCAIETIARLDELGK